ncbi:MAG: hypothetical protein HOB49_09240, partial [Gemmatimonadetes bacterium]|nr:hypothetical protein [Gemmatimonadota bacterium]
MTAVNTTADLMLALDDIDDDVVLDLPAIFGNDDPVEIELGIGKGRYLLGAAKSHTDVNYIGVEVAIKYLRLACDRAGRRQLNNIRFVHGDAREFVEFFLPSESVQAFQGIFGTLQFIGRRAQIEIRVFARDQILVANQKLERIVAAGGDPLERLEGVDVVDGEVDRRPQTRLDLVADAGIHLAAQARRFGLVDLSFGQPFVDAVQLAQADRLFLFEQILLYVGVQMLARPAEFGVGDRVLGRLHLLDALLSFLLARWPDLGGSVVLLLGGGAGQVYRRQSSAAPPLLASPLDLGFGHQFLAADDLFDRSLHAGRHTPLADLDADTLQKERG